MIQFMPNSWFFILLMNMMILMIYFIMNYFNKNFK